MTYNRELEAQIKFLILQNIRIENSGLIKAFGSININIFVHKNKKWVRKYIKHILYMPDVHINLLSSVSVLKKTTKFVSDSKRYETKGFHNKM